MDVDKLAALAQAVIDARDTKRALTVTDHSVALNRFEQAATPELIIAVIVRLLKAEALLSQREIELAGALERARTLFKYKNEWADRARKAEAQLETAKRAIDNLSAERDALRAQVADLQERLNSALITVAKYSGPDAAPPEPVIPGREKRIELPAGRRVNCEPERYLMIGEVADLFRSAGYAVTIAEPDNE